MQGAVQVRHERQQPRRLGARVVLLRGGALQGLRQCCADQRRNFSRLLDRQQPGQHRGNQGSAVTSVTSSGIGTSSVAEAEPAHGSSRMQCYQTRLYHFNSLHLPCCLHRPMHPELSGSLAHLKRSTCQESRAHLLQAAFTAFRTSSHELGPAVIRSSSGSTCFVSVVTVVALMLSGQAAFRGPALRSNGGALEAYLEENALGHSQAGKWRNQRVSSWQPRRGLNPPMQLQALQGGDTRNSVHLQLCCWSTPIHSTINIQNYSAL